MSRSIFGWSYPPGCSGPPEDPEPFTLRYKHCKAFIGGKPVRKEPWECSNDCSGFVFADAGCANCGLEYNHPPHKDVWDSGVYDVYICKRCGKETKIG